jgi:hypothetical protein
MIEKLKNNFMTIKPQIEGEIQGDINVNLSRESIGLASVQREMSDPDQQN